MRNINIPSGRGLILSGDRQRAGTFVGIAKRRMYEMKQMMRIGKLKYMKRVYYLDRDCVWVHLTSIDGSDFIRIHSCAEGEKCSLSLTATDLGGNQAQLDFKHETTDTANFYRIEIDSGGVNLSGNNRYSAISGITKPDLSSLISRTITFLTPGEYTVTGYAFKNDNFVTHSSSWSPPSGVPSYEVDLDMGSITKAVLRMSITTLNGNPSTLLVNDISVPVASTDAFKTNVFAVDLDITANMNIKVSVSGDVLRDLNIVFTEVKCLAQVTRNITVT